MFVSFIFKDDQRDWWNFPFMKLPCFQLETNCYVINGTCRQAPQKAPKATHCKDTIFGLLGDRMLKEIVTMDLDMTRDQSMHSCSRKTQIYRICKLIRKNQNYTKSAKKKNCVNVSTEKEFHLRSNNSSTTTRNDRN